MPAPAITPGSLRATAYGPAVTSSAEPRTFTALLESLGVSPPAIGVLLDCGCPASEEAADRGEVMLAGPEGDDVVARFRSMPFSRTTGENISGWQLALALLDDAFGGDAPLDALPLFRDVALADVVIERSAPRGEPAPPSRFGVRRYFDALGAIALVRPHESEGRAAFDWNAMAVADERRRYRYEISRTGRPWQLDLRQAVRDLVFEVVGGEPAGRVAARFQNTVAAAAADLVRGVASARGPLPVVLAGSCFRNPGLAARVRGALTRNFQIVQAP